MFVNKENTKELAQKFVKSLRNREIDKPLVISDKFYEELALESFKRYVGSVSYAMLHKRSEYFAQMKRN